MLTLGIALSLPISPIDLRRTHPHDFDLPDLRLFPSTMMPVFPQSQSQNHFAPLVLGPAYPVTVSMPNFVPVRSIRLGNVDASLTAVCSWATGDQSYGHRTFPAPRPVVHPLTYDFHITVPVVDGVLLTILHQVLTPLTLFRSHVDSSCICV